MKGVVLTGGHGTHLRPLTHTGPKQLLPLVNKPNVLYCVEDLRDAGITDIGIILGDNMPEKVRELLGDGSRYGVHFTYLVQGPPKGIAHAIACARDFVGRDAFCVYLGDNVLKGGIRHMVEEFQANNHDAGIALCPVAHPERFGVAELDAAGNVTGLVEKPKEPKSNLALVGIYLLRPSIFPIIDRLKPSWRNELEIGRDRGPPQGRRESQGVRRQGVVERHGSSGGRARGEPSAPGGHRGPQRRHGRSRRRDSRSRADRERDGRRERHGDPGARRDRGGLRHRAEYLHRSLHIDRRRLENRRGGHRSVDRDWRGDHRDPEQDREQFDRSTHDNPVRGGPPTERHTARGRRRQHTVPLMSLPRTGGNCVT